MKTLNGIIIISMISACKQHNSTRQDEQLLTLNREDISCTKTQKNTLESFGLNSHTSVKEVLDFLLYKNESKAIPICTKSS